MWSGHWWFLAAGRKWKPRHTTAGFFGRGAGSNLAVLVRIGRRLAASLSARPSAPAPFVRSGPTHKVIR